MKRIISLLLAFVMLVLLSSCAEKKPAEEEINIVPQVERMRSICELGVIDCYYHNVAKCFEENAEGVLWWKKDKLFWVEYDAVVSYGIDFAKLDMTISDDVITIFIPQAKLQSCTIGD